MKDEIKQILAQLEIIIAVDDNSELILENKTCRILYDYITNLQEKYEEADNDRHKLFEQKEKAIELLKEAGCYDEETKTFCDDIWEELPKLLNILNGGDEE